MMAEEDEEQLKKKTNSLPIWGNQQTMNINNLVVTNILSSPYFKNELYKIKTFHEVIDEIYYKVQHLEPWEKGSRKIRGQVGMCGGVRGVGTGGIVSSTFCLLFKLFTLKLTKKQVYTLINHCDSPYIRGLGFMFIRFCQHPNSYWEWFEPYLEDDEEIDPKAGGGSTMTIGQMVRSFLLKPDWYGTLFPRIPVPIFKEIEVGLKDINLNDDRKVYANEEEKPSEHEEEKSRDGPSFGEAEKYAQQKRDEIYKKHKDIYPDDDRPKHRHRSKDRQRHRSYDDKYGQRSSSGSSKSRDKSRDRSCERSRGRSRNTSRDRSPHSSRDWSRDRSRKKSPERSKHKTQNRSRERYHDRSKEKSNEHLYKSR